MMAQRRPQGTAIPSGNWMQRAVRPFGSLAYRDFRLLWIGNLGNSANQWMEIVVRSWLVFTLTGSLLAVGMVNFVKWLPTMVLAIPSGVITDRVDRKLLLLISQSMLLALYILLAALAFTNTLRMWEVYALFALLGAASTFSQPARQSLIAQSVPREQLTNALSLQQMAFNGTRLGGPTLAGFMMATLGSGAVFTVIALGSLLVVGSTALLRLPNSSLPAPTSPFKAAAQGLTYVAKAPLLRLMVLLSFCMMALGFPFTSLMPGIAKTVFGMGSGGFGILLSASGAGSLLATFIVASFTIRRQALLCVAMGALFGVSLIAFASTPLLPLALGFLVISGIFSGIQGILNNSLLLGQSDPSYHGRIMSLFALNHSFMPIGALPAGWLADHLSAPQAMAIMGVATALSVLVLAVLHPSVLRLQIEPQAARQAMPAPARGGSS